MTTLFWSHGRSGARAALDGFPGAATVLVSTPRAYHVVVHSADGLLRTADDPGWALPAAAFQLIGFDGARELRWLADGDSGRAAWLAESAADLPAEATGQRSDLEAVPSRTVLWGRALPGDQSGFSTWSDGRIGTIAYPVAPGVADNDRLCLDVVEYVGFDEHGNASVVERRSVGLRTVDLHPAPVR